MNSSSTTTGTTSAARPLAPGSTPGTARHLAVWLLLLLFAFAYRLGFGLCSEFFSDDETQIFLIGLRHFHGAWPYFGADVVWTRSQIPGALQGLLVGVPMRLLAIPEAPCVLLNLLSLSSLLLLGWYIRRRLPELPRWLVFGWLLFLPWTLNYGTHVLNPDYVLCAAIVFFVGFFEANRRLRLGVVPLPVAHAAMGAAVGWTMQIHMSWPLLGPFVLIVLWQRVREGIRPLLTALLALGAGAAVTGSLLLPTFWRYGLLAGGGGTHRNLSIHVEPAASFFTTLARMLSFPSLEVGRFLGIDTAHRLQLLADHWWMIPFAAIAWAAGIVQPVWMASEWFRAKGARAEWRTVRWLLAGSVVLVYFSYWFVMEPPQAHAFYVLAPLAFVYSFYCWTRIDSRTTRGVAAVVLASSICYHAGLALARAPERSLYRNRSVAVAAMMSGRPDVFGHRRPFAMEGAPVNDVFASGEEVKALQVVPASASAGVRGTVLWTITVRNTSTAHAYRDIAYDAIYRNVSGQVVDVHHDVIADILQPGQSIAFTRVNHGYKPPFATVDMLVVRAHRLLPLSAVDLRPSNVVR